MLILNKEANAKLPAISTSRPMVTPRSSALNAMKVVTAVSTQAKSMTLNIV
jgi:hypothetical protein